MTDQTDLLLLVVAPTVAFFVIWVFVRQKPFAWNVLMISWVVAVVVLSAKGAMHWEADYEFTQFASACSFSASIWFVGPWLAYTANKQWHPVVSLMGCVLLPIASVAVYFLAMAFSGQIWGM